MKRAIRSLLVLMIIPFLANAQVSDIAKLMDKGEVTKAYELIRSVYAEDTSNVDRYYLLYRYYTHPQNEDRDSLVAFDYLIKYNAESKKKIDDGDFARELLPQIYRSKDVARFDKYIELAKQHSALVKEAERIRNQLAYDQVKQSQNIYAYQDFVSKYPDAVQADEATQWINENLIRHYVRHSYTDSLRLFASQTQSEAYRKKATEEIDKLSFNQALKENTAESYNKYLQEFPNGNYSKMARINMEKARYEQYVTQGSITDMLYYLDKNSPSDKNYKDVLDRLAVKALEHYSLIAMKKYFLLTDDSLRLEDFAKAYVSDWETISIDALTTEFPFLAETEFVKHAKSNAETLLTLKNKQKLTLEDYKKHKTLFKNLNAHACAEVFASFEELNNQMPKNKSLNFGLDDDAEYIQFCNARQSEYDFVLSDADPKLLRTKTEFIPEGETSVPEDLFVNQEQTAALYSKADTDGYGYYNGSLSRDIYICIKENGKWSKPSVLPMPLNSRYDECRPVLSPDGTTLWFSSNRSLNFGGKDIYVSFRKDTSSWDIWSEPVLLSEDFNTKDDDYIINVLPNAVVVSQDETFDEQNNIYLEGNTQFSVLSGYIRQKNGKDGASAQINIWDKKTATLVNTVKTEPKSGYFCFIRPQKEFMVNCSLQGAFSPLNDSVVKVYFIDNMVNKQELVTVESPFDNNSNLTPSGKKSLEMLARKFASQPCILTVGVHCLQARDKLSAEEVSQKQAKQIFDFLVKNGMGKDNLIVTGYGNKNIVQGWEKTNSMDIGAISK